MNSSIKIVSLLPAATEMLCALGLGQNLVGRSHECDYPAFVKNLPVCTSSKLAQGAASLATDRQVKQLLNQSAAIYDIDAHLIEALEPAFIVTQGQCEVCAVSFDHVEAAVNQMKGAKPQLVSITGDTLTGIFADLNRMAGILGATEKCAELMESYEERIAIVGHKLKYMDTKPSVACIEWLEPLMLAGNWVPGLVDMAGGINVLSQNGKHSPYTSWEDLRNADPDILVVMPCGFGIEKTLKEMDILLDLPGFADLQATKNNRVYIADGNQYFNRPGPRIIDSIEILAEMIYPKQFNFGYEGEGWIKFGV